MSAGENAAGQRSATKAEEEVYYTYSGGSTRNHPDTTETDGSPIGKIGYPSPKGIYEGIGKSSPIRKFTREMSVPECCLYEGYATTVNAVGASPNPKRGDQSPERDGG